VANRVLFASVSHPMYGVGGAEIQTYHLARQFAERNWEVYYLSKSGPVVQQFNNSGINLLLYRSSNWMQDKLNILYYLIKIRPKVVYYRFHKDDLLVFCFIKLWGGSVIWAPMSNEYSDKFAATKYRRSSLPYDNSLILGLQDRLFRCGVSFADGVVVQNREQYEIVFGDFNKQATIIYNSVEIVEEEELPRKDILFVAAMKFMKRPELFCKLAGELPDFKFKIVGSNYKDEVKAQELQDLMKEYNVEYLGPRSNAEVRKLFKGAKILVNTSDFEGFPSTFAEAFAAGCPVVSLNVNPDGILTNYQLGDFCKGDFKQLVVKVARLMNDDELWRQYSHNCRQFALENLDINKNVDRMEKMIGLL